MLPSRVAAVLAFLILSFSLVHAQLGPKDGASLKPIDLERVKLGESAPDFTLENIGGQTVTLSEFRDKKNVVLVFYRGQW